MRELAKYTIFISALLAATLALSKSDLPSAHPAWRMPDKKPVLEINTDEKIQVVIDCTTGMALKTIKLAPRPVDVMISPDSTSACVNTGRGRWMSSISGMQILSEK